MKGFFEAYQGTEKLAQLVREIGWSHNIVIMERCNDPLEREFYLHMTRKFDWSKNVLIHQIANQSYEKSLLGQTNFDALWAAKVFFQCKRYVGSLYEDSHHVIGGLSSSERGEFFFDSSLDLGVEVFAVLVGST